MAKRKTRTSTRRKSTASSARRRKTKPAPKRRTQSRKAAQPRRQTPSRSRISLILEERKQDVAGVIALGLGILSALSLLSPQGAVTGTWLSFLKVGFGWGMFVVPLGLLVAGGLILGRNVSQRIPQVGAARVLGLILLYLAVLVLLHLLLGVRDLDAGLAEAREGRGGGVVGAGLLGVMLRGLGLPGTVVALIAWLILGCTLTFGISLPDLLLLVWRGLKWAGSGLAAAAGSLVERPREEIRQPFRPAAEIDLPPRPREPEPLSPGLTAPPEWRVAPEGERGKETPVSQMWSLPELGEVLDNGTLRAADEEFDRQRGRTIEDTLQAFGAPVSVVEINRGPAITQFGVEPGFVEGRSGRRTKVKVSKISALADDLALALAATSVRVEAPVPGRGFVGIEVPNAEVSLVALRDVMESKSFQKLKSPLRLGLGKDVSGHPVAADLTAMPHLLIAGTTGSGKSVCINAVLSCLLLQNTPEQLRLVMVDPKRVELTYFNGIPHLLSPVVVELERVVQALKWVSREMDDRYHRFAREGVRNIAEYNARMMHIQGEGIPYLVVVVDELADLMMLAPDETERVLTRLAQLARATGIHLVIATQRPSVDVVTGLIKANFPARIAFAVASSVDSRVILDQPGAERLLGRGDMLFQAPDASAPVRLQGAFVSEKELSRLIRYWKNEALGGDPTQPLATVSQRRGISGVDLKQAPLWEDMEAGAAERDVVFDQAVEIVRQMRRASISLLQRRLRIGYTRAARLIDQLEAAGVVGPPKGGSKAREVLDYGDKPQGDGT